MEQTYTEFEQYPWDTDHEFQSGLQHVIQNVESHNDDMVLKAKAFYYNRKFGVNIDPGQYQAWKGQETDSENTAEEQPLPQSYASIVELILAGKPIPGIKQIPDTVLGRDAASESVATERKKPWEK